MYCCENNNTKDFSPLELLIDRLLDLLWFRSDYPWDWMKKDRLEQHKLIKKYISNIRKLK